MKRNILLLSILWASIHTSDAQHLYLEIFGTAQMPLGGMSSSSGNTTSGPNSETGTIQSETLNFGAGNGAGLVFGRTLSDHLAIELRGTYLRGRKQELTSKYTSDFSSSNYSVTFTPRYLRIEPALRFRSRDHGGSIYAAVGPSLLVASELELLEMDDVTFQNMGSPYTPLSASSKTTYTYKGGLGLGGFGALGFSYRGDGPVGFFVELNFTAQYWAPKEADVQQAGTTTYPDHTEVENDRYTVRFEDEISASSSDRTRSIKVLLPYTSWGVRAGIAFTFGSGAPKAPATNG